MTFEEAKAGMLAAKKLAKEMEALESTLPPDVRKAGREWLATAGFDAAAAAGAAVAYGGEDARKDRQRLIPISAVIAALAEMEDALVGAAVAGPWKQGWRQVAAPFRAGLSVLREIAASGKEVWDVIALVWEHAPDSLGAKIAAVSRAVWAEVQRAAGASAGMIERLRDDPAKVALELFTGAMAVWTVAVIQRQIRAAFDARAETVNLLRARALPQPARRRVKVRKRTRN